MKTCLNPSCGKKFKPGHYGQKQMVCGGGADEKCPKCRGTGKRDERTCPRCGGKRKVYVTCRDWYKRHQVQSRKRPRGIPPKEMEALLKRVKHDPHYHALLAVASESAMRKSELLGLTWDDVLDGDSIRPSFTLLRQWKDGQFKPLKTSEARAAFLLEESRIILANLWKREKSLFMKPKKSDRIWPYTATDVWERFQRLQRKLKVKNPDTGSEYRFHDLRHTAAIAAYRATGDIKMASTLCGHKNLSTTMIYTETRPDEFAANLDSALKKKKR
jgi:integrase